ncbi:PQQ-dependent oxidoreductase, gdhB family [Mariniradius saccharolyticus AK6]|uniref:PQQ-dependent oxidoreductase, gdhB family n=1 Tax=Mariniradius saccharolyticus AK6 TaxID=1239962 RepID=M7XBB6_9BACT|nr:PQQ-dependent sugar dehydrogenase [Mariniradius saccharolyticus]EMS34725.1 PQQ-dependent oxidoreductase, gdhB family [Mariniradius saccharolyticus AK6]
MKTFKNIYLGLAAASFAALVSCAEKEESTQVVAPDPFAVQTEKFKLKIDTLYTEFINPWGMTWLPDGTMLVTERKGEILVFKDDKFTGNKLSGVPAVSEVNQAGLLDIAVHPKYAENGWIYLSYARKADKGEVLVISRAKLSGNALTDLQEIFVCNPEWEGGRHFGSRIVFDNDGYLYFSNGDKGSRPMNAQELNNDHGKIHRIHDDGRIPADNPFVNTPGASPSIWTYGNRNPQGMIYDKANNRIWAVEHGPKGGDELNLIEKGKNYGWPVISYGINYDGSILTELTEKEGMEQPVTYWVPSIATCGMALVTSDVYPEWKGNILVAGLAGMQIARVELEGTKYKSQETLLKDIGRVRQVSESPDGYIYAITEATSLLVKLVPQR